MISGENPRSLPEALASVPMTRATFSMRAVFHVQPCMQGIGNITEPPPLPLTSFDPPPTAECSVSAEKEIGIPSRVLFTIHVCSSFCAARPAGEAEPPFDSAPRPVPAKVDLICVAPQQSPGAQLIVCACFSSSLTDGEAKCEMSAQQ